MGRVGRKTRTCVGPSARLPQKRTPSSSSFAAAASRPSALATAAASFPNCSAYATRSFSSTTNGATVASGCHARYFVPRSGYAVAVAPACGWSGDVTARFSGFAFKMPAETSDANPASPSAAVQLAAESIQGCIEMKSRGRGSGAVIFARSRKSSSSGSSSGSDTVHR